ncbi:MAG: hypothetical protein AAGF98_03610 [Cyanobacteria bacterium P01_H01_bin.153]
MASTNPIGNSAIALLRVKSIRVKLMLAFLLVIVILERYRPPSARPKGYSFSHLGYCTKQHPVA